MAGEMEEGPGTWFLATLWLLSGRAESDPAGGIRGPYVQAFNGVMF